MTCPNCDAEMEEDVEEGVWICPDCGYVEDRG
jgi:ribosomal protein L37AE/L43A